MVKIYRNPEFCAGCDGHCCKAFLGMSEGGIFPEEQIWFEDWCVQFHGEMANFGADYYGVTPLFDPLVVHKNGNGHLIEELKAKGIDPDYCQYFKPGEGCMIPWEKRPIQCKVYKCEKWPENDPGEDLNLVLIPRVV